MLLSLKDLARKHRMRITGVVHCGAHLAEEAKDYDRLGVREVWWFEANPLVINQIRSNLAPYDNQFIVEALLADVDGAEFPFHITNFDGMSSSIYEFGKLHLDSSPDTKFVEHVTLLSRSLDSLADEYSISGCNFLNMDLQGAELLALKGASNLLGDIEYIYTEVNADYVYQGCGLIGEIDDLLKPTFKRVETSWTPAKWGDALYVRTK